MLITRSRSVHAVATSADYFYGVNAKNQTVAVPSANMLAAGALTAEQIAALAASVPTDGSAFSVVEVTPYVQMTATGIAFSGPCEYAGYDVVAVTGTPTITVYAGLDNTGDVILAATTLTLGSHERTWKVALETGCYVELSGTQTVNILVGGAA